MTVCTVLSMWKNIEHLFVKHCLEAGDKRLLWAVVTRIPKKGTLKQAKQLLRDYFIEKNRNPNQNKVPTIQKRVTKTLLLYTQLFLEYKIIWQFDWKIPCLQNFQKRIFFPKRCDNLLTWTICTKKTKEKSFGICECEKYQQSTID